MERSHRAVNGVILLDKPSGISSNAALQSVKRLYDARKAGHAGSLDPLASGLLPICLGEATKVSGFLLDSDKTYQFVCCLGVTTTTGDADGEVTRRRPVGRLQQAVVKAALQRFLGEIQQVPPMFSALKYRGRPLYKLARQGLQVERQPRKVTIHTLRLLRLEENRLACEVRCSKGTYVRTLAEELGEALGCGAHVIALRRLAVEPYDASQMVSMDVLRQQAAAGFAALDALLLPTDTAIRAWPAVYVQGTHKRHLLTGQTISLPRILGQGWVRLYEGENRFLGVGEILGDGSLAPRRLLRNPL